MSWNIKSILKEIVIGVMLLFIASNAISYIRKPILDTTQLPQMKIKLLDGTTYISKKGKPLVIHFLTSWCPTCKIEANNIESISKQYDVLSVSVNSGSNASVKEYMKKRGLTFKVLNDTDGKMANRFHIKAYPTTLIYDANGELKFTEVGYTSTIGLLARLKLCEK